MSITNLYLYPKIVSTPHKIKKFKKKILIQFSNSFFPDGTADVKSKGGLKSVSGSVKRDSITSTKTQKKEP